MIPFGWYSQLVYGNNEHGLAGQGNSFDSAVVSHCNKQAGCVVSGMVGTHTGWHVSRACMWVVCGTASGVILASLCMGNPVVCMGRGRIIPSGMQAAEGGTAEHMTTQWEILFPIGSCIVGDHTRTVG